MKRKIYGVTVGTPLSPSGIKEKLNPVTSVNGTAPDEHGNVEIDIPDSGCNVDLTGYATERWVKDQEYLTEVPEGYATKEWVWQNYQNNDEAVYVSLVENGGNLAPDISFSDIVQAYNDKKLVFLCADMGGIVTLPLVLVTEDSVYFSVCLVMGNTGLHVTVTVWENNRVEVSNTPVPTDAPTDDHINSLIDTKLEGLTSGSAEWTELANYTLTEDVSALEYSNLSCKEFVMLVNGRVNDAADSLANANAITYTYVNGVSHGGAATAFYIRPAGASYPVLYHVEALGGVIEQSASRKSNGSNMGNLVVSERLVEGKEINHIRVWLATNSHLIKAGATIKVWVR